MTVPSWLFATVHLLGLGIGLGAIAVRARALRGPLDGAGVGRVLAADTWWGVSAVLLIGTGLARAFGGLEKGSDYYLQNHLFWTKMALLLFILVLEAAPMVALIRWRVARAGGQPPDTRAATRYARVSELQAALVVAMVFVATAMARGAGLPGP